MSGLISELVYPSTDRAVLAQLIVIVVVWAVSAMALRRNRDLFHFATGLAILALAWRGLRATH